MITENLSTLKIHKLSREQYERARAAGTLDEHALYLTPDEELDLSGYATKDDLAGKADVAHSHDDVYYTEVEIDEKTDAIDASITAITDGTTPVAKATAATQDGAGNVIAETYETKTDADTKIAGLQTQINTIMNNPDTEGVINSINEFTQYIEDHGEIAEGFRTDIDALQASNHSHENKDVLDGITADKVTEWDGKLDANGWIAGENGIMFLTVEGNSVALASQGIEMSSSDGLMAGYGASSAIFGKDGVATSYAADKITAKNNVELTFPEKSGTLVVDTDIAEVVASLNGKADAEHTHDAATESAAGFMTPEMVTKLANIADGATAITVDEALSAESTNPVQNKVINGVVVDLASAISANTTSISAHSTAITNLQTEIDSYEEITSDEIIALFNA